ncbi:hypothetical protein F5148DRAFT_1150837 [Russula earlei]|uniref:Uncharacterized protein n=1 Tax=Russula earlei TaxID=71964 RepID=A0ACC0U2M4_9AGAM|nr:hypothetical protein F5148DRAFT_1150837 [Russula earlei]
MLKLLWSWSEEGRRGGGEAKCTKAGAVRPVTRGHAERPADGAAAARTRRTDKGGCEESSNVGAELPKGGRDGAKEWGSRTATRRRGDGNFGREEDFVQRAGEARRHAGNWSERLEFRSRGASCSRSGAKFTQLAAPPVHSERGASGQSRRTRYNDDRGREDDGAGIEAKVKDGYVLGAALR